MHNMDMYQDKEIGIKKDNPLFKALKTFLTREETKKLNTGNNDETRELLESIKNARKEWLYASKSFEHADDWEIIDYYTYEIKACQVRYDHLIKKAKEKGIKVELICL